MLFNVHSLDLYYICTAEVFILWTQFNKQGFFASLETHVTICAVYREKSLFITDEILSFSTAIIYVILHCGRRTCKAMM